LHDQCDDPQRQGRPNESGFPHLGNDSSKYDVLGFHKLNFLFLFWPSLVPRREKLISGRSPRYSAGFSDSLRRKCRPCAAEAAVPGYKEQVVLKLQAARLPL
jgi:hypothetical protein